MGDRFDYKYSIDMLDDEIQAMDYAWANMDPLYGTKLDELYRSIEELGDYFPLNLYGKILKEFIENEGPLTQETIDLFNHFLPFLPTWLANQVESSLAIDEFNYRSVFEENLLDEDQIKAKFLTCKPIDLYYRVLYLFQNSYYSLALEELSQVKYFNNLNLEANLTLLKLSILHKIKDRSFTKVLEEYKALIENNILYFTEISLGINYYNLGFLYFRASNYPKAIIYLSKAIDLNEGVFYQAASLGLLACYLSETISPSQFLCQQGQEEIVSEENKVLSNVYQDFLMKYEASSIEVLEDYILDVIYYNLNIIMDHWTHDFFAREIDNLTKESGNRDKYYKWKQRSQSS